MSTLRTINYYPALREYVGSINAALIVAHLESCFREQGKIFYKFMEPCGHGNYIKETSWVEELQMTSTEFRTAFKHIGIVYKSKREYNLSQDKFQGKMYLSYYDRISKLTYYMRNDDLVDRKLKEILKVNQDDKQEIIEEKVQQEEATKNNRAEAYEMVINADTKDTEMIKQGILQEEINQEMINQEMINQEMINQEMQDRIYDDHNINTKTIMSQKTYYSHETDISHKTNDSDKTSISHKTNDSDETNTSHKTNYSHKINYKTNISLDSNRYAKSEDRFNELREIMASEEKQIVDVAEIINQEIPYEAIKESFNQICQSHQPVQTWSYWQQKKIKCLWEKYGQDLKTFQAVFEKVEASDFLSGRIKNWKARLDWLLKPNHFSDILNGKYENFEPICTKGSLVKQKWGKGFCVEMLSHDWDFDEIEQLEQRRIDSILESRGFVLC